MDAAEEFTRSAPMYGTLVAIGAGITSLAFVLDWRPGQVFLIATGGTYTVIILVAYVYHLLQSIFLFRHDMAVKQRDLEAMWQEDAPEAAPRVAFPPMGFVSWIWDWREAKGKFPTVRECTEAHKGWNGGMVQQWYQEMVNAGAVINRLEKQTAGDPAPDWPRARFEKAAVDAATSDIT